MFEIQSYSLERWSFSETSVAEEYESMEGFMESAFVLIFIDLEGEEFLELGRLPFWILEIFVAIADFTKSKERIHWAIDASRSLYLYSHILRIYSTSTL